MLNLLGQKKFAYKNMFQNKDVVFKRITFKLQLFMQTGVYGISGRSRA